MALPVPSATRTSICLPSTSFTNLCLDHFQFSGQYGLGEGLGTHVNNKVLNIRLVSYHVSPQNVCFTLYAEDSLKQGQAWNSINCESTFLKIIRGLHLSS